MNEFIYPEMMVHVGLCTNKDLQNVLIVSDNSQLLKAEVAKHDKVSADIVGCSLDEIGKLEDKNYDVVISEMGADAMFISHVNRVLKDDGQFVSLHPELSQVEENKSFMKILGQYFKIIMPFNLDNGKTALLSSKEYHPTADINLHRCDMLDGLEFYNCDVHIASFAMGNYIRKEYLGIIRN